MAGPTPNTPVAPNVNPTAPTYQPPTLDYNTYLQQAQTQLAPSYDQRIQSVNSQTPLIQQQYANYINDLKNTYTDQTNQANRQMQAAQGDLRAHNAALGINDQGQEQAQMQNQQYNTDTLLKSLANALTNKTNAYNNEEQQNLLKVKQMADQIANERDTSESNTAHQLMAAALQQYDDQYNREYQQWQSQNDLSLKRAAMLQAQQNADRQYQLEQAKLGSSSNASTMQNQQWALGQINSLVNAANGDMNKAQDSVYRFIKSQGPMLAKMGVDNNSLWQSWQGLKSLADQQTSSKPSTPVGTPSFGRDFNNTSNGVLGGLENLVNYFAGTNEHPFTSQSDYNKFVKLLGGR